MGPTAVSDTVGSDEGVILLAKWLLIRGRDKIHDNSRSCAGSKRSKNEKKRKLSQEYENNKFD
jgi:hypothetical protein